MTYSENELNMVKDMADSAAEMLEAAGAKNVRKNMRASGPGWAIHEVGIARMANDPKKSVLNQFQQTHDVKNGFRLRRVWLHLDRLSESYLDDHDSLRALHGLFDGRNEGAATFGARRRTEVSPQTR